MEKYANFLRPDTSRKASATASDGTQLAVGFEEGEFGFIGDESGAGSLRLVFAGQGHLFLPVLGGEPAQRLGDPESIRGQVGQQFQPLIESQDCDGVLRGVVCLQKFQPRLPHHPAVLQIGAREVEQQNEESLSWNDKRLRHEWSHSILCHLSSLGLGGRAVEGNVDLVKILDFLADNLLPAP